MGIIRSPVKVGQKPSKEALPRIKAEVAEARKRPINLDDCPEVTDEQLAEFQPVGMTWEERTRIMAERRARRNRQTISLRLPPSCIEAYKENGKGYTSIMADVLIYAARNPDILRKATQ